MSKGAILFIEYNNIISFTDDIRKWSRERDIQLLLWSNSNRRGPRSIPREVNCLYSGPNVGLATAYNEAIHHCKRVGITFLQLFDDDTVIDLVCLTELWAKLNSAIFILAPNHYDADTGEMRIDASGEQYSFINSGSIWNLTLMNFQLPDALFVDYIDHFVAAKARNNGLKINGYRDIILPHKVGESTTRNIFGRNYVLLNHGANRKLIYYRSRAIFHKALFFEAPLAILRDFGSMFKDLFLTLCYEKHGMRKFFNGIKGYGKGWFGFFTKV